MGLANAPQASAEPCPVSQIKVVVVGSGLSVCVPQNALPTVTITLPRVTSTVTLPRVTATRTVQKIVNGKNITSTVRVPGPVSTRTVFKTVDESRVTTVTQGTRQTVTESATIAGPTVTATVTETHVHNNDVVITKTKAVGLSLLLLLIGVAIGLALLWGAYTYGWLQGDGGNRRFLRELRDDLKYKD